MLKVANKLLNKHASYLFGYRQLKKDGYNDAVEALTSRDANKSFSSLQVCPIVILALQRNIYTTITYMLYNIKAYSILIIRTAGKWWVEVFGVSGIERWYR